MAAALLGDRRGKITSSPGRPRAPNRRRPHRADRRPRAERRASRPSAGRRVAMLVFRQLFDPQSSTYTYLLGDRPSGAAVLIDPVFEQVRRDAALLAELGLKLVATLETHIHADHVTGAWLLKQRTGSRIMLAASSGAVGADRQLV